MTLMELLAALVLSVLILTTIGIVLTDESSTWHSTTTKELLQSSLVTVNSSLIKTFQGMQSPTAVGQTEVRGPSSDGTSQIDVRVQGQDIVITTTSASGQVQQKVLNYPNQTLGQSVFQLSGTTLIQATLVAASTSPGASLSETMQTDFVVGAGY